MSAGPLAPSGTDSTVNGMDTKRRSPVVARFEIISDLPAAGEHYQHTVTVQRNGRVRSVVSCVEREETAQEWAADQPPTLEDLADLLIEACYDDYHESRLRLLSAVVHGLLPQGNHLWRKAAEIPDAVLDASLGFGPRTTYRVELQRALVAVLRGKPSVSWGARIQSAGTEEHEEFVGQVDEASTIDPEWLRRSTESAASGTGTPFDELVAWTSQDDFDTHDPDTWYKVWGEDSQSCYDSWNDDWSITAVYGQPRPGEVALLVSMPDYEDGFTLLPLETTREAAAEEAARRIEDWVQEIGDNNPDFRTTGSADGQRVAGEAGGLGDDLGRGQRCLEAVLARAAVGGPCRGPR